MTPKFPPWLVETVPELADIGNNAIYHLLTIRSRKNRILDFTGPLLMLSLSAKFLHLPFAHDSLYLLLYFSMPVFLRMNLPQRQYAEFVRFFGKNREEMDLVPLDPREAAIGLWAAIGSPEALRPRRRVVGWILASSLILCLTGIDNGVTIGWCLMIIGTCVIILLNDFAYPNRAHLELFTLTFGKASLMNVEQVTKLERLQRENRGWTPQLTAITSPALPLGLLCCGILMSIAVQEVSIILAMSVLVFTCGLWLPPTNRPSNPRFLPAQIDDLGFAIRLVLASIRGERVLTDLDLHGKSYAGRDRSFTDFSDSDLSGCDFSGTKLRWADLRRTRLDEADLSDADLASADLRGARLPLADLRDARLDGALLEGADLRFVQNLTREQIDSAVTDATTLLPEGF